MSTPSASTASTRPASASASRCTSSAASSQASRASAGTPIRSCATDTAMRSDDRGPVLILAPNGRDAPVAAAILGEIAVPSRICPDLDDVVVSLDAAGGAILAEEALLRANRRELGLWIERQPPWS